MKLLLAALFLAIIPNCQAAELTRFVNVQPPERVREVCAHVEVWQWGCTVFLPATDNPGDIICMMVIPAQWDRPPWDEEALLVPLRLQCLEGAGR